MMMIKGTILNCFFDLTLGDIYLLQPERRMKAFLSFKPFIIWNFICLKVNF